MILCLPSNVQSYLVFVYWAKEKFPETPATKFNRTRKTLFYYSSSFFSSFSRGIQYSTGKIAHSGDATCQIPIQFQSFQCPSLSLPIFVWVLNFCNIINRLSMECRKKLKRVKRRDEGKFPIQWWPAMNRICGCTLESYKNGITWRFQG